VQLFQGLPEDEQYMEVMKSWKIEIYSFISCGKESGFL
jgi:hypothetical protein